MAHINSVRLLAQGRMRRTRYGGRTYVKVARHFRRCVECQDISQATGRLCGDGQRLAFAPWGRRR